MYLGADYRQGGLTAQVLFVHGAVRSKVQQKIQKNYYSIEYQYFVKKISRKRWLHCATLVF